MLTSTSEEHASPQSTRTDEGIDISKMSQPDQPSASQTHASKLAAKRNARIKAAFATHETTGAGRISRVTLLASPTFLSDKSHTSILSETRLVYPTRLQPHTHTISNLLLWHLDARPTGVAVLIFTAEQFLAHLTHHTLDGCAQFAISQLPDCGVVFAVSAINRVLQTRNRAFVRQRSPEMVFSRQALQDCYVHLDVEYGIRVHVAASHSELAHTVRDWTNAIANLPCHREADFLEATVRYRRARRKGAAGAVIALGGPDLVPEGSDDEDDRDVSDMTPRVRAEGRGDPSFWYMSFIRMIPGVSVDKAKAIRHWFPSFNILMEGYARCADDGDRVRMLADIRFGPNRRRIGPHLSRSIFCVLHGQHGSEAVPT